ncbi:unnamed protein product [Meloidogyne enterolobii]|uniref:Uncharacterized protein n=1 Tax=Meloidogyne enterolobii TaxID=390850 RepID=A0ACB1A0C4_MELEN
MADKRKSSYSKKRESSLTKKDAQDKIKKLFDQKLQGATGSQRITVSAGARSRSTMARESRAMSAVGSNKMSVKKDNMDSNQRAEAGALEAHLRAIQPFNECWFVESTISAGTYGVAFRVLHKNEKTKAVIKVARSLSGSANSAAEWEAFVLEKMWRREPGANVVRILDKGMLQDQNDEALEFMALEFCDTSVREYINGAKGFERKERVCRVALGSLKGLYDLHANGFLHRDMKPDNMGMITKPDLDPVCVLYDLGMARMYTDGDGNLRTPRTICPFRGTPEWASGHSIKGREQTRFDDLVGWFYVMVELFDQSMIDDTSLPFPWDFVTDKSTPAMRYLKSIYSPARLLLKRCPPQFNSIYMYLMCANRGNAPDYDYIANLVGTAIELSKAYSIKQEEEKASLNNGNDDGEEGEDTIGEEVAKKPKGKRKSAEKTAKEVSSK